MREQHHDEATRSDAGGPREGAADGVQRVEHHERAAPDAEAGGEPPETAGWNSASGYGTGVALVALEAARAHGRPSSIAARWGSASTRPSAIAAVTAV